MLYKVFYTENNFLIPKTAAGATRLCFVFIRNKYRNDQGLLQHELVHVRQFYRLPFLGAWLYMLSKKFRLRCELEAYREQLKYYPQDRSWVFAGRIANGYGLDITVEEVHRLLTSS